METYTFETIINYIMSNLPEQTKQELNTMFSVLTEKKLLSLIITYLLISIIGKQINKHKNKMNKNITGVSFIMLGVSGLVVLYNTLLKDMINLSADKIGEFNHSLVSLLSAASQVAFFLLILIGIGTIFPKLFPSKDEKAEQGNPNSVKLEKEKE